MRKRVSFFDRVALRVALLSAGAVATALVMASIVTDVAVQQLSVASVDHRLGDRMAVLVGGEPQGVPRPYLPGEVSDPQQQQFDVPLEAWFMNSSGDVVAETPFTPDLPQSLRNVSAPTDAQVNGVDFRLMGGSSPYGGWIVIGQSRAVIDDNFGRLLAAEVLAVGVLSVLTFFGALFVGRQVARPIEAARQRQLAFTADASHELRTPVAVIEAETALALSKPRKTVEYKDALSRVSGESARLSRMIDELLWLARFDAAPKLPDAEPVELRAAIEVAAQRFSPIAEQKKLTLSTDVTARDPQVLAPEEWIGRLLGVLIDNACRYTPEGGKILVQVISDEGKVTVAVEDSGPGIPVAEREQIFQRFHRVVSTAKGTDGAGLGLAIADAVVKSTKGSWEVGESDLGGARFSISWETISTKQQSNQTPQHL